MRRARSLSVPVVLLSLCFSAPASAVGEAVNGFPTWNERVMLVLTNRARVNPQTELSTGCVAAHTCADAPCYAPVPPLYDSDVLAHSARFHSLHQFKNGYQAHTTPCALVTTIGQWPAVCPDAAASCSCVGGALSGGMTAFDARIKLFGGAPFGEIIHSSSKPDKVMSDFLNEPSASAMCGNNGANGHRYNLLTGDGPGWVGFGGAPGIVGDFGGPAADSGKIPSGGSFPNSYQGAVELWVNYYDAKAPTAALVNVAGACSPVTLGRGAAANGAYTATVMNVGACTAYYFTFKDGDGNPVEYPTTGALQIGNTPEQEDPMCPSWTATRPPAGTGCACAPSCSGKTCGDDGCGGSCGECPDGGASTSSGAASGAASAAATGAGAGSGGGAGGTGGATATSGSGPGAAPEAKGCGCRAASDEPSAGAMIALLGVALAAAGRRRVEVAPPRRA